MTQASHLGNQHPFEELPGALVEEVLDRTSDVSQQLLESFENIRKNRSDLRSALKDSGLVITEASLGAVPLPTTCATDGSYAIERMLTKDLAAAAAVAVEGLTPPSEKRHWDQPRHKSFITLEPHHQDTATVLRAVMMGEELLLATNAPHDLLMLDGTFTLPIIYFNQAIGKVRSAPSMASSQEFLGNCVAYLSAYFTTLQSERSDRYFVAFPKYSTRREIGTQLDWPDSSDDRGMLTMLLDPGEITKPTPLAHPRDQEGNITWHLNTELLPEEIRDTATAIATKAIAALKSLQVLYYKPQSWLPALRIEIAESVTTNQHRLATVIQGIKHQTSTPSMLEPYPIYLADRTVKNLARAVPAFRQAATQQISEEYNGNIEDVFFAMHGYRSETGR